MQHLDPDDLALIALGEDVAQAAHLAECSVCSAEVASLRRVVLVGRESSRADIPASYPPPGVWERIHTQLGLAPLPSEAPAGAETWTPGVPGAGAPVGGSSAATGASADADAPDAVVHVLSDRRRRFGGWIAGAAAAGVLVGAVGGAWWSTRPDAVPNPTVLAEAALDPLPGWDAAGTALVQENADGSRVVVVDVDATLGDDALREVWLIAPDLSGMVSLGLLEGTAGEFVIPAGVDLARYPVVDVSSEPLDGDATHSGNSIVRGVLDA